MPAVILFLFFGYHSQIMPHRTPPNSQLMGICFFLSNPNCCNLLTHSVLLLPPYNLRGCFADGTLHLPGLPLTKPKNKSQISLWDIAKSNNCHPAFLGLLFKNNVKLLICFLGDLNDYNHISFSSQKLFHTFRISFSSVFESWFYN